MIRFLATALVVFALAGPTAASEHNRARDAVRSGQILPLRAIAEKVRNQFGGKVIDVSLDRSGNPNSWRYAVKVLQPNGRVIIVTVRASDAKVLGVR